MKFITPEIYKKEIDFSAGVPTRYVVRKPNIASAKLILFLIARRKYTYLYGDEVFETCKVCSGIGCKTLATPDSPEAYLIPICEECNGFGGKFVLGELIFKCDFCNSEARDPKSVCPKCQGTGYVDFLENVLFTLDGHYNWRKNFPYDWEIDRSMTQFMIEAESENGYVYPSTY